MGRLHRFVPDGPLDGLVRATNQPLIDARSLILHIYPSSLFYFLENTSSLPTVRPEHSTGRAGFGSGRKKLGFLRNEKILPMTVPWDVSGLSFRAGRAARAFIV
jgi:hypothetical protein